MQHEIKKAETYVVLTMTVDEFLDLYDNFPSRHDSGTSKAAIQIDEALAKVADQL